jgi:putative FmdB family regulatory protein
MPLYECYCRRCDLTFEVLASLREASKSHPCPECGRRARRMLSAVVFGRAGGREAPEAPSPRSEAARPDVTRLKVPPPAQLCWMDQPTSSRYAAYLHGRGSEYDDTVAARTEQSEKRGTPAPKAPSHQHSHSPLADPAVYARRRAAGKRSAKESPAK